MESDPESDTEAPPSKKRKYCFHCLEYVGYSTYYRHRERFFDPVSKQWTLESCSSTSESLAFSVSARNDDFSQSELHTSETIGDEVQEFLAMDNCEESDCSLCSNSDDTGTINDLENDLDIWETSSGSDVDSETSSLVHRKDHSLIKTLLLFLAIWQFAFRISNNAITNLLGFLKFFIHCIGKAFQINISSDIVPTSFKGLHKSLYSSEDDFISYVVCSKCDSIYEYNDCIIIKANGNNESKECSHVPYPRHPYERRRKPCGNVLLNKIRTKSGQCLRPNKIYPYLPLSQSLSRLLKRNDFVVKCEQWHSRASKEGYLCDVYDGRVWHTFNSTERNNFLSSPHNYLLTLNIDWFEPYKRSVYSVGAIYLSIQNLPREDRYKPENILLVGIIPGPSEPKLNINSYLAPLVLELKEAWDKGLTITSYDKTTVTVKLALTCIACDIPASRKVCGFLGHNASLGCNKCLNKFKVSFGERTDYSGFDRDRWSLRSIEQHCDNVKKVLKETTKTKIREAEAKYGVRYSVLLELPYFDPVRYTVIDIMHNMFLGTAKHIFQVWVDVHLLTNKEMAEIEDRIKLFITPADCGRLPSNISSSYSSFTAAQWRNWITIYSPVVLKGLLPVEHLRCWLLFVQACQLLCRRIIQNFDVVTADLYLLNFCKKFENLYPNSCTMNLHLHLHLKECFFDYGPPHAFWAFPFERFNGILESYFTNKKEIEGQIMRKFCQEQAVHDLSLQLDKDVLSLLPRSYSNESTEVDSKIAMETYALAVSSLNGTLNFGNIGMVKPLLPYKEGVLDAISLQHLKTVYYFLYPDLDNQEVLPFYDHYGRITLAGDLIGSVYPGPNARSSAVVMANWPEGEMTLPEKRRVGCVQYFLKHKWSIIKDGHKENIEHMFAFVLWKKTHVCFDYFGTSAIVLDDEDDMIGPSNFIPVQRILYRCAFTRMKLNLQGYDETVFVACPIVVKHSL